MVLQGDSGELKQELVITPKIFTFYLWLISDTKGGTDQETL